MFWVWSMALLSTESMPTWTTATQSPSDLEALLLTLARQPWGWIKTFSTCSVATLSVTPESPGKLFPLPVSWPSSQMAMLTPSQSAVFWHRRASRLCHHRQRAQNCGSLSCRSISWASCPPTPCKPPSCCRSELMLSSACQILSGVTISNTFIRYCYLALHLNGCFMLTGHYISKVVTCSLGISSWRLWHAHWVLHLKCCYMITGFTSQRLLHAHWVLYPKGCYMLTVCVCVCVFMCAWHAYLLCKRPGLSWDGAP